MKALLLPAHSDVEYRYVVFRKGNTDKFEFEEADTRSVEIAGTKVTFRDEWSNYTAPDEEKGATLP